MRISLATVPVCWPCYQARTHGVYDMRLVGPQVIIPMSAIGECAHKEIGEVVNRIAEKKTCTVCMGGGVQERSFNRLTRTMSKAVCDVCNGSGQVVKHGLKPSGKPP